jgi:Flp pilus assembly protein TadG
MRAALHHLPARCPAVRVAGRSDRVAAEPAPARLGGDGDGGAALAELALILPFLAVLIIGCLDVGRAYALKGRVTNMAREGAFRAQNYPTNIALSCSPSITAAALAEDREVNGAVVTVANADTGAPVVNDCSGAPPGAARVRVEVTAPLALYTPFAGSVVGNEIRIRAATTVAVQG